MTILASLLFKGIPTFACLYLLTLTSQTAFLHSSFSTEFNTVNVNDDGSKGTDLRFLKKRSLSPTSLSPYAAPSPQQGAIQKHYVFLVHGWLGNNLEMAYLESAIQNVITSEKKGSSSIVVHKTECNKGKTTDGIANGGARLADEMIEFISEEMSNATLDTDKKEEHDISISIVGNSLGGLYARYAVSLLPSSFSGPSGKTNVHFNIFCTTATPHLGVASHTYIPLPRIAEKVIGNGMAATGRDLFCLADQEDQESLIYQMATLSKYTQPLSKFRKRIAYANAFDTEFQVPTETAAFLCENSSFPHWHKMDWKLQPQQDSSKGNNEDENKGNGREPTHEEDSFIAVILETEKSEALPSSTCDADNKSKVPNKMLDRDDNRILTMSMSLDSLGWTKVFVDVRDLIPIPGIPKLFTEKRNARERIRSFLFSRHDSFSDITFESTDNTLEQDERKREESNQDGTTYVPLESREVADLVTKSERLHFPLGHTVMIANSRNEFYSQINARGKPVMDKLAENLVNDILKEEEVGK